MKHAYMQLSELKKLEWEELVWVHDALIAEMTPRTVQTKTPVRAPEVFDVSS